MLSIGVDIAQILVGIAALVSLWLSYTLLRASKKATEEQRVHNRTALKPAPYLALGNYQSGIAVRLRNEGLGSLRILSTKFTTSDEKRSETNLLKFAPPQNKTVMYDVFAVELKGRVISPGQHITLLELRIDRDRCHERDYRILIMGVLRKLREDLSDLKFELVYSDLYEDEPWDYSKDLEFMKPENAAEPDFSAFMQ